MGLSRRPSAARRRLVWLGLGVFVVLGLAAVQAWLIARDEALNERIASGTLPADDATARPEMRFALAHAQAASGAADQALRRYGSLHGSTALGLAARYNSANLLLRQGMALRASTQPGQALALIELAKEGYREVLRADPEHWAARYNLERAQRLVPDPEAVDEEPAAPGQDAERAATTMRGFSPGLP